MSVAHSKDNFDSNGIYRFRAASSSCMGVLLAVGEGLSQGDSASGFPSLFRFGILLALGAVLAWCWSAVVGLLGTGIAAVVYRIVQGQIVVSENLVVVPNVGIQLETEYASGRIITRFYRISIVRNIFVHEAISWLSVVSRLAFAIDGTSNIVFAFPNSKLSNSTMAKIYRDVDSILFPSSK